jgi:hypothetical protein
MILGAADICDKYKIKSLSFFALLNQIKVQQCSSSYCVTRLGAQSLAFEQMHAGLNANIVVLKHYQTLKFE